MIKSTLKKTAVLLTVLACNGPLDPSGQREFGLGKAINTGGPKVVFDVLAKPLPEVPLPNDVATRLDPTSATGRRLNISLETITKYERRTREAFNKFDGFGTYAPLTVSFDAPLDLSNLRERHKDTDFRNDVAYLLNISPNCRRFGEEVYLDMGNGRFPAMHYGRSRLKYDPQAPDGYRLDGGNPFFDFDPMGTFKNLLFAQENEDTNQNGVLDVHEDLDQDGNIDIANLSEPTRCDNTTPKACAESCENDDCFQACLVEHDRCIADNLLDYYERETNTLIMRPIWPLEQRCRYAVVLTDRLTGVDGKPVESPFETKQHRNDVEALSVVPSLLTRYGLTADNVQFAWVFTTGSMTTDIESIRAGLYGHGPFSDLSSNYPPSWRLWPNTMTTTDQEQESTLRDGACIASSMGTFWKVGVGEFEPNLCALEADSSSIGGLFAGTFESPSFLFDREDVGTEEYPSDHDEVWDVDPQRGRALHRPSTVTFWCALPKKGENCIPGNPDNTPFCPPYPTAIFAHGYGGSRLGVREHLGRHTAMGSAVCAIDGPGHGSNVIKQSPLYNAAFLLAETYFQRYGQGGLSDVLVKGRDRDLNNDGLADSGGDMWTADLFHTRDMVRQSVVDHMQFVRVLRHLTDESGDLDGDGQLDLGGTNGILGMWGISLGGVISGVMAGAEPSLDAVSPNAGGAGLVDIAVRSRQDGVPDAVVLPMIGPLVVGCLPTDGHDNPLSPPGETDVNCLGGNTASQPVNTMQLGFIANDVASAQVVKIGTLPEVSVGDRIEVTNLVNGEARSAFVNRRGFFRIGIPGDAMDAIDRRALFGKEDGDYTAMTIEDPSQVGDRIEIRVYRGDSTELKSQLSQFGMDVQFQGSLYKEGKELVVLQEGYGHRRNNPSLRRLLGLAQHGISQADPAVWGAHSFLEPLETDYDPFNRRGGSTNVLLMPTIGDVQVPTNTGIAMARVSGLFGSWLRNESKYGPEVGWREIFDPHPSYGQTIDDYLFEKHVIEGDATLQRYRENTVNPNALFDLEDWSNGSAAFSCGDSDWSGGNGESLCPSEVRGSGPACEGFGQCPDERQLCVGGMCEYVMTVPRGQTPLRQTIERENGTFDAFRMPLLRPAGQHGIYNAQAFRFFDHDAYAANYTIRFLTTGGGRADDPEGCDCSAATAPTYLLNGQPDAPTTLGQRACGKTDLKICTPQCLEAWGIRTPSESNCQP